MTTSSDFDAVVLEFMNDDPLTAYYVKEPAGTYNTATGSKPTTPVEIPVQAILLDLTLQSNGLSAKFGTLVMAGDKELYIRPPEKTDPQRLPLVIDPTKDKIKVGTTTYKIVSMKEINPSGTNPILYDLYLRR